MNWDFKQYNNYEADLVLRSTSEKYNVKRFSSKDYSRIIITKEVVGIVTPTDNVSDSNQDGIMDLEMSDIEGMDDLWEVTGDGLDLDLADLDLDSIQEDLDFNLLDGEGHKVPSDNPEDGDSMDDLISEMDFMDKEEDLEILMQMTTEQIQQKYQNQNMKIMDSANLVINNDKVSEVDKIENSFGIFEEEDLGDGTLLSNVVESYGNEEVEFIGQEYGDGIPTYQGKELVFDSLNLTHSVGKIKTLVNYEYGDFKIQNYLVNLCNKALQTQPKNKADVQIKFVWETAKGFSRTLGTTQSKSYTLDGNIDVVDYVNIEGSLLEKKYEDDDFMINIEFKKVSAFRDRKEPLPKVPYRKTTKPDVALTAKMLGSEHKVLTLPPVDYFKSFLNINFIEKCNYRIVDDPRELKAIARHIETADKDHVFAYDAETTGLRFHRRISPEKKDVLVTHSLSWEDGQSIIVPIRMRNRKNISTEVFNEHMKEILETRRILCHHGIADVRFLIEEGIDLNLVEDTYHLVKHIMPYLQVDEMTGKSKSRSRVTRGLDALVKRAFGVDLINLNKYIFKPAGISFDFSKLNDDYMIYYGCPDTDMDRRLWKMLRPKLEQCQEIAYRSTVRFSKILGEKSTYEGVKLSQEIIIDGREKALQTMNYLEEVALELAGQTKDTLNIGSSKQVANYIYGKMGVPVTERTKRTESNELAADKDVLTALSKIEREVPSTIFKNDVKDSEGNIIYEADVLNGLKYPFTAIVRSYADVKKDLTAYYDGLLKKSIDQMYFPEPRVGATATWRTTERTQITKSTIKKGLIPYDDEHYWVALDFAAEELRLAVNQSEDYGFMDILDDPEADPHTATASDLFGLVQYMVSHDDRARAKGCNFGIIYGIGILRLAKGINQTEFPTAEQVEETRKLYGIYVYKYSRMISALKPAIEKVQRDGFLYNNLYYKMIYDDVLDLEDFEDQVFSPHLLSPPVVGLDPIRFKEYGGGLKNKSGNYPIQSWAAGLLMILVIAFAEKLKEHGIYDKVAIPLTVHDEVDLIVHQSVPSQLILKILVEVFQIKMEYLKKRTVPLYVGIGFGNSWGEAKEDENEIPVNLQQIIIDEYDTGNYDKDIPATEIPAYYRNRIEEYMRDRIRQLFPEMIDSRMYITGTVVDQLRNNMFILKKCNELFGIYESKTDTYHHDKILEQICIGKDYNPLDFNIKHTKPTEHVVEDVETKVVDFYFNPIIHERIMILGSNVEVDVTGLKEVVVKNLLTYLLQFRDETSDKSKNLVMRFGGETKEVKGVKILGLPIGARDIVTDIMNGKNPPMKKEDSGETLNDLTISDVLLKTETKVFLDITVFPEEEREEKLKQLLKVLSPWLSSYELFNGKPLVILDENETITKYKLANIPMEVEGKIYNIIKR